MTAVAGAATAAPAAAFAAWGPELPPFFTLAIGGTLSLAAWLAAPLTDPASIDWTSGRPKQLSYRQQPGKENPLGFVKINFHNQFSVYMHDTPQESLFGASFRAASSGCVRVLGIDQLATWLLADQGWTQERVQHMKQSGERLDVRVKRPVPLYFAYISAWATEDGVIQFRRDIYAKDGVGTVAATY